MKNYNISNTHWISKKMVYKDFPVVLVFFNPKWFTIWTENYPIQVIKSTTIIRTLKLKLTIFLPLIYIYRWSSRKSTNNNLSAMELILPLSHILQRKKGFQYQKNPYTFVSKRYTSRFDTIRFKEFFNKTSFYSIHLNNTLFL